MSDTQGPSSQAPEFLCQRLRQACGDPGSVVVRRGMTRDGRASGEPFETVPHWQLGAVVSVLCDEIERLRGFDWPDVTEDFMEGWDAALTTLSGALYDADGQNPQRIAKGSS